MSSLPIKQQHVGASRSREPEGRFSAPGLTNHCDAGCLIENQACAETGGDVRVGNGYTDRCTSCTHLSNRRA